MSLHSGDCPTCRAARASRALEIPSIAACEQAAIEGRALDRTPVIDYPHRKYHLRVALPGEYLHHWRELHLHVPWRIPTYVLRAAQHVVVAAKSDFGDRPGIRRYFVPVHASDVEWVAQHIPPEITARSWYECAEIACEDKDHPERGWVLQSWWALSEGRR